MTKSFLALGLSVACSAILFGQAPPAGPVTMNSEPHHERLTYLRHMRVFEATVAPGESTLDHLHDHDVVSIVLGPATTRSRRVGEDWSAARTRESGAAETTLYTGAPATHRTENAGSSPLRLFVVENLRDGGWSSPAPVTAPGTTLRQDARSFAVYDVRLNAATPRTNHLHENPSFVFLLSGSVDVQGGGGESEFRLEQPGRWFPSSGPDQPHTLTAAGTGDAHVICIEAR
jgi:quercetin dioxygenase-like cupin family protein